MERKFKYNRFGLTENPIGQYIAMSYGDRTLLGNVVSTEYNHARSVLLLNVRHFNGEMWPVQAVPSAVTILE